MAVRTHKFTPELLLSAPRRSAAIPNKDGTLAIYSVSTYCFRAHKKSVEIHLLNLKTGDTRVLNADVKASEPTWLGEGNLLLFLKSGEKGTTSLYLLNADKPDDETLLLATFDGAVSNLKTTQIDSDKIAIAVTGLANPDGELFNPEKVKKPISSAKVYTELFVRHWDSYTTGNRSTIWYTTLTKLNDAYKVAPLKNSVAGYKPSLESPIPPFGGSDDFDISKNGIVFVARDPKLDPSNNTKSDLYYIPLRTFEEKRAPDPLLIETGDLKGYSSYPVFSPNAKSVVFTRMKSSGYESDKPRLILVPDIQNLTNSQEFFEAEDGNGKWDLRPESITWSLDGNFLYVTAEENGRGVLCLCPYLFVSVSNTERMLRSQDYHAHIRKVQREPSVLTDVPQYPNVHHAFKKKTVYEEDETEGSYHNPEFRERNEVVVYEKPADVGEVVCEEEVVETDQYPRRNRGGLELHKWKTYRP